MHILRTYPHTLGIPGFIMLSADKPYNHEPGLLLKKKKKKKSLAQG